jgi:hypothetical protein
MFFTKKFLMDKAETKVNSHHFSFAFLLFFFASVIVFHGTTLGRLIVLGDFETKRLAKFHLSGSNDG